MSINSKGKPSAEKYFATDNPVLPNPIMMLFRPKSEFFKVLPMIPIHASMLQDQKGQTLQLLSKIALLL